VKLRTRLFLRSSALLTMALAGLLLATFSVLQLTRAQGLAVTRDLDILQASQAMERELGRQTTLLLAENLDRAALLASLQRFRQQLDKASVQIALDDDRLALRAVAGAFGTWAELLRRPYSVRSELLRHDEFASTLAAVRERLNDLQIRYVRAVEQSQQSTRETARIVAGLLGLSGMAIILIGMITAHSVARQVAEPIESLAGAADRIGRGDFDITLPVSRENELRALIQRFGLMAESVREFKHSDVEALQAEQRRLQAVLDSIDDGLLILDPGGRLEHFNPVARRQLGWDGEALGQRPGALLADPDLDQQVATVLRGESLDSASQDLAVTVAGEPRVLAYSVTPVSREGEAIRGAVMVLRDVTEQRAFERMRNEFVLRASHELRTPITGMQMGFGLLRERLSFAADSREADLLQTVDGEMQRLLALVNDLLDFTRYQSGQQQLDLQPCELAGLVESVCQRFQAAAAEAGVELRAELPSDLPRLYLDPLQLGRVLDNLVGNALRHSPAGTTVRVAARRSGEQVEVAVVDQGKGIPYSQQGRVFEPFVQVGDRKGGAGLGLALCREILQLHGGRIWLDSRPGQGARFVFSLPVTRPMAGAAGVQSRV